MNKKFELNFLYLNLIVYVFIFYLIFSTGYFSDDFSEIDRMQRNDDLSLTLPSFNYISIPVLHYTHYIFFSLLSFESIFLISFIKSIYTAICCFMSYKFFSLFTDKYNSIIISFLFLFWPTHDSTVYWFLGQYLMLTISFYLYSYYLIEKGNIKSGIFLAFFASFISYGSTPVAFSLAFLFLLKRRVRNSIYLVLPNIVYIIYYIFVSKVFSISPVSRIPDTIQLFSVVKNFIFQIISFFDSNFGLGFILKIYNSMSELNIVSFIVGIFFLALIYFVYNKKKYEGLKKSQYCTRLIITLFLITLSSMLMFSISGGYFQTPFNLGNRVMIYSSLLLSYLFVISIDGKFSILIKVVFVLIIFSIIGISNHWKFQTNHQLIVINNIKNNEILDSKDERILFVVGNQYSQLGKMSHIEFFSESHVAEASFGIAGKKELKIKTLNHAWEFDGLILSDKKYKNRTYEVKSQINIYDTENDKIKTISSGQIESFISSLPNSKRHWIQLVSNNKIKNIINKYLPRLNYLF